jgi:hypothetical protein
MEYAKLSYETHRGSSLSSKSRRMVREEIRTFCAGQARTPEEVLAHLHNTCGWNELSMITVSNFLSAIRTEQLSK